MQSEKTVVLLQSQPLGNIASVPRDVAHSVCGAFERLLRSLEQDRAKLPAVYTHLLHWFRKQQQTTSLRSPRPTTTSHCYVSEIQMFYTIFSVLIERYRVFHHAYRNQTNSNDQDVLHLMMRELETASTTEPEALASKWIHLLQIHFPTIEWLHIAFINNRKQALMPAGDVNTTPTGVIDQTFMEQLTALATQSSEKDEDLACTSFSLIWLLANPRLLYDPTTTWTVVAKFVYPTLMLYPVSRTVADASSSNALHHVDGNANALHAMVGWLQRAFVVLAKSQWFSPIASVTLTQLESFGRVLRLQMWLMRAECKVDHKTDKSSATLQTFFYSHRTGKLMAKLQPDNEKPTLLEIPVEDLKSQYNLGPTSWETTMGAWVATARQLFLYSVRVLPSELRTFDAVAHLMNFALNGSSSSSTTTSSRDTQRFTAFAYTALTQLRDLPAEAQQLVDTFRQVYASLTQEQFPDEATFHLAQLLFLGCLFFLLYLMMYLSGAVSLVVSSVTGSAALTAIGNVSCFVTLSTKALGGVSFLQKIVQWIPGVSNMGKQLVQSMVADRTQNS